MTSSSIRLLPCGASKALLQSVDQLFSRLSIACTPIQKVAANAVVVGSAVPEDVLAAVVMPSVAHPAYSGLQTTIVRSILPRRPPGTMQLRDALDVYPNAGVDTALERGVAIDAFRKSAHVAIQRAKELQATHITVVIKPVTKFELFNELFLKTVSAAIAEAGLTSDVMNTARAANELLLFTEKFQVVLTNDDPACQNVQLAFAGAVGGSPAVYHMVDGGKLSGGHSLKAVALGAAIELKALGFTEESERIQETVQSGL